MKFLTWLRGSTPRIASFPPTPPPLPYLQISPPILLGLLSSSQLFTCKIPHRYRFVHWTPSLQIRRISPSLEKSLLYKGSWDELWNQDRLCVGSLHHKRILDHEAPPLQLSLCQPRLADYKSRLYTSEITAHPSNFSVWWAQVYCKQDVDQISLGNCSNSSPRTEDLGWLLHEERGGDQLSPTEYKGGGRGGGLKRVDCHLTAYEGAGD